MSNRVENSILDSAFEDPRRYRHDETFDDLPSLESMALLPPPPSARQPGTPGKKTAVKVINHCGNEMLEVFELERRSTS